MKNIAIKKIEKATIVPELIVVLFKNVENIILNTKPVLAKGVAKLNLLLKRDEVKKYKPKKLNIQSEIMAIKSKNETFKFNFNN